MHDGELLHENVSAFAQDTAAIRVLGKLLDRRSQEEIIGQNSLKGNRPCVRMMLKTTKSASKTLMTSKYLSGLVGIWKPFKVDLY